MKYIYADFTMGCVNYGNQVIEFATQKLLSKLELGVEVGRFDSFDLDGFDSVKGVEHDAVIIPGCTMLTHGQNPGLVKMEGAKRIVCLAGSIWTRYYRDRYQLLGSKMLVRSRPRADLTIAKMVDGVVGCRDRYTYEELVAAGIKASYVGCPTLFLEPADVGYEKEEAGYILFSFGRENLRKQVRVAEKLSKTYPVVGISHEKSADHKIRAHGWNGPLVSFNGDIKLYLSYFLKADMVLTGRLHGLLPSIAFNKKVAYFGERDSRITILDDLGVPVWGLNTSIVESAGVYWNKSVIQDFREKMERLAVNSFYHE